MKKAKPESHVFFAQCAGKTQHVERATAEAERRNKRDRLQVYKCDHCHHWHVGSNRYRKKHAARLKSDKDKRMKLFSR